MSATLVVMAAGIGSRFGGLKQAEPITPDGKCILDFSVYDAVKTGFDKAVFIIREDIKDDFIELVGNRLSKMIPVEYVMQDMSVLPEGRKKPFGTGHAILCCKDAVKEPFVVINADDYYGSGAFGDIYDHILNAEKGHYAMTAYRLGNTLSSSGVVTRGVCQVENGYLKSLKECKKINGDCVNEEDGERFSPDTPVSMNLWGLTPDIFDVLENEYADFLAHADTMKDEFLIPNVIFTAVHKKLADVKVYTTQSKWYGITYREDLEEVKRALNGFVRSGLYG